MYKSIFEKIKKYSSNPIDEYNKIIDFIYKQNVDDCFSLHNLLKESYAYCSDLNSVFPTFDACIDENCSNITEYESPAKSYYESIADSQKELLLDEFLTFSQVVLTIVRYYKANRDDFLFKHFLNVLKNENGISQLVNLITTSLKCFNYKAIANKKDLNVELILDNPIAEAVADASPTNISDSIIGFLGSRDTKTKERFLHDFIDLLEPSLKELSDLAIVKKIRGYVQLVRHPETKATEKQYEWFSNNKKKYLDELFMLCLFVQEYSLAKQTLKEFDINKANSSN